jgi:hypothetical protein
MFRGPRENVVEVVVEFEAYVDRTSAPPSVRALAAGRPVLVKTTDGLYDVTERGYNDCTAAITPHKGEAKFDLSHCLPTSECEERVWSAFAVVVRRALTRDPFLAMENHSNSNPHRLILERLDMPSTLLGPPYFEKTQYAAELWFYGDGTAARRTFGSYEIELNLLLKKNPNTSTKYSDPDSNELLRYNSELDHIDIPTLVCSELHGTMTDGRCTL